MSIMKSTITTYEYNERTRELNIPFDYLRRDFVVVTLSGKGKPQKTLKLGVDYRFTSKTEITVIREYQPDEGFNKIIIRRVTDATKRIINFQDGSILNASELNVSQLQSLHVAEEARDLSSYTLFVDDDGNLDARGRKIINLGDPEEGSSDAVNVKFIEGAKDTILEARDTTKRYRDEAEGFRNEAEEFKNQANTFKTQAESAKDRAVQAESSSSNSSKEAQSYKEQATTQASKATQMASQAQASASEAKVSQSASKVSETNAAMSAKKAEDAALSVNAQNLVQRSSLKDSYGINQSDVMSQLGSSKSFIVNVPILSSVSESNVTVGMKLQVNGLVSEGDCKVHLRVIGREDTGFGYKIGSLYANLVDTNTIYWSTIANMGLVTLSDKLPNKTLIIDKDVTITEPFRLVSHTKIICDKTITLMNGAYIYLALKGRKDMTQPSVYYKNPALNSYIFRSKVSSNVKKGSSKIPFVSVEALNVGDVIVIRNGYCDMWRLFEKFNTLNYYKDDIELYGFQIAKVKEIEGNTVTIDAPLKFDLSTTPITYFKGEMPEENNREDHQGWNISNSRALKGGHNCYLDLKLKRGDEIRPYYTLYGLDCYDNTFKIKIENDNAKNGSLCLQTSYNNIIEDCDIEAKCYPIVIKTGCQDNRIQNVIVKSTSSEGDSAFLISDQCHNNVVSNVVCYSSSLSLTKIQSGFYENTSVGNTISNIVCTGFNTGFMSYWGRNSVIDNIISDSSICAFNFNCAYKIQVSNCTSLNPRNLDGDMTYTQQGISCYSTRYSTFSNIKVKTIGGRSLFQNTYGTKLNNVDLGVCYFVGVSDMLVSNFTIETLGFSKTKCNVFVNGVIGSENSEACIEGNDFLYETFRNVVLEGKIGVKSWGTQYNNRVYFDNVRNNCVTKFKNFVLEFRPSSSVIPQRSVRYTTFKPDGTFDNTYEYMGEAGSPTPSKWRPLYPDFKEVV